MTKIKVKKNKPTKETKVKPDKAKKTKKGDPLAKVAKALVEKGEKTAADGERRKVIQEGEGWRLEKDVVSKSKHIVIDPKQGVFSLRIFSEVLHLPGPSYPMKKVVERGFVLSQRLEPEALYHTTVRELKEFVMEAVNKTKDRIFKSVEESGVVTFDDLPVYFAPGTEVYVERDGLVYGAKVAHVKEQQFQGGYVGRLIFTMETIEMHGPIVNPKHHNINVKNYEGATPIKDLPFSILTPEQKEKLAERGKVFRSLVEDGKPKYMTYTGELTIRDYWWTRIFRATGRVVIHGQGFEEYGEVEGLQIFREPIGNSDDRSRSIDITDDVLWMCSPVVYGFSFYCKQWGELKLDNLSGITFRKDAIDKLVLDADTKRMALALVKHNAAGFSDVIEGKGGGTIFLLHGAPGVGKTLTAEAIAETLCKPLYTISAGELGTMPTEVEENLRKILELASIWDAVVLLDEADVFLERRTSGDAERNAIVSVFLRLLEYHQGVLFLTSNRVSDFDPAFHSRISITIHYDNMGPDTRQIVWQNLLTSAGVKTLDATEMALLADINGRQIKNLIRSAMALAKEDGKPVDKTHVEACLKLVNNIHKEKPAKGGKK